MQKQRRYSIGAGIADFYFAAIISGALSALYVAARHQPVPVWEPFLRMLLLIVGILIYYSAIAPTVGFRSPGEVIMGRVIINDAKQWTNPYGTNRSALFAMIFVALIIAGNSWDSVADDKFYSSLTYPVIIGRSLFLTCLLTGLVMIGRVMREGPYLVFGYFVLRAIVNAFSPSLIAPHPIHSGVVLYNTSMAVTVALIMAYYFRAAATKAREKPSTADGQVTE